MLCLRNNVNTICFITLDNILILSTIHTWGFSRNTSSSLPSEKSIAISQSSLYKKKKEFLSLSSQQSFSCQGLKTTFIEFVVVIVMCICFPSEFNYFSVIHLISKTLLLFLYDKAWTSLLGLKFCKWRLIKKVNQYCISKLSLKSDGIV